ncbi:MAG: 2-oxoglutarate dehydrogenase complex dihydrolipoyllysine-residue succinyltransferase [Bdellovibrionales bacterium]
MSTQILVPPMGESVSEATVAKWLKNIGDAVRLDEPLVELETDKVTLEVNAVAAGIISEIKAPKGANVKIGAVLGLIQEGAGAEAVPQVKQAESPVSVATPTKSSKSSAEPVVVMPAARKQAEDRNINPYDISGTGRGGRVMKEDVVAHIASEKAIPHSFAPAVVAQEPSVPSGSRPREAQETRVQMSRLRQRVAQRLKEAQNSAAMLTTFNEVDMSSVIALRNRHKDAFEKKHKVKLGFMSFFVKACILALKEIPVANAEIEDSDIVYKNYYDIGVAIGTPQGLVVPVLRDADKLGYAGIERSISEFGQRAREGKLAMADLMGGTFTITNGGVYGSLMSTPILNPPQSAILGMHAVKERAVVIDGAVVARPMMYLALSYDHRLIDGRDAVTFLVRVKESIENPERLLVEI